METVLEPVINYGAEALFGLVAALLSWAIKQGADWLGIQKDSAMYGWLEGQVDQALRQAQKRVKAGELSPAAINTDSEVVDELSKSVARKARRYLRRLRMGEGDVREMVLERL